MIVIQSVHVDRTTGTGWADHAQKTLAYDCVCAVNGLSPNISEYSQTIPYFICTESNNNCVTACNGASSCQAACREARPCGAQNPTRVNESTITTSATSTGGGAAASTASDGAVYTGFGGSAATTTAASDSSSAGTNAAAVLLNVGQLYGLGVVAASLFLGFSFLI